MWLCLFNASFSSAQNQIPNGSFEEIDSCPQDIGEFNVQMWNKIGVSSTPDLFSLCAEETQPCSPMNPYNNVEPFMGGNYIRLVTDSKSENYREYVSTRLQSTLVKDSLYRFQVSFAMADCSILRSQFIDVVFSESPLILNQGGEISLQSTFSFCLDSLTFAGTWTTYSVFYRALGNEKHLALGNFHPKKEFKPRKRIKYLNIERGDLNYSLVCIDYLILQARFKTPLEIKAELASNVIFDSMTFDVGFEKGSSDLVVEAIPDFSSIIERLIKNPQFILSISGHTDKIGNPEMNLQLSMNRAWAVADYFAIRGVNPDQIRVSGLGDTQPKFSNDDKEGRLKNRRVELKIIGR
jgi:outer membrane protein OmpA-like peptidoglycan-associated protein